MSNNSEQNGAGDCPPSTSNAKGATKHRSGAKTQRDAARQTDMRKRNGAATMEELQRELDKRLHFGFSTEYKAALAQANNVSDQAEILPVTTRALGLFTQAIFIKTQRNVRNLPQCTPFEHYRVSLAQHETRCIATQKKQVLPYNAGDADYARPQMTLDQQEVMAGNAVNFGPISNAINAIGNFEYNNHVYYPRVPSDNNLPKPHLITFSNLRRVVTQMSMRGTPQEVRLAFYNANPLPFARWGPPLAPGQRRRHGHDFHPDWPLLENPEDYMPEDYDIEDLEMDCSRVRDYLNACARKSVKYVDNSSLISYDCNITGSPTLLVTSYCTRLRNPDSPPDIDYQTAGFPTGDLSEFWASQKLDNVTTMMGALQLSGEVPPDGLPHGVYAVREVSHARIRYDHRWSALVQNFLA